MISFKQLSSSDKKWLLLLAQTFRQETITEKKADDILKQENIWIFVAHTEQEICAYVLAYKLPRLDSHQDMLMIYHCFVLEKYKRQHLATTLLNMVLEKATRLNLHYTFLITQEENHAANKLYQSLNGQLHDKNKNVYYWYGSGKPNI